MELVIVIDCPNHFIPPFIINYTKVEERILEKAWNPQGDKFIPDSLGYGQCLAFMYNDLPTFKQKQFNVKPVYCTYQQYNAGAYRPLYERDKYPFLYGEDAEHMKFHPTEPDNVSWVTVNNVNYMKITR